MIQDIIRIGDVDFEFTGVYSGFFGIYLSKQVSRKGYAWVNRNVALEDFKIDFNIPDDCILVNLTIEIVEDIMSIGYNMSRKCIYWLDTICDDYRSAAYNSIRGGSIGDFYICGQYYIVPAALVPTNMMEI